MNTRTTCRCRTCNQPINENTCVELRGALAYHIGCAPSSISAPRTIWQALLALVGSY